ncbi:hypothetical protein NIES2101_20375 [Calothrix sp. HK-06]|nr:hypothetical protein NIES2101_20375 [Calothrix sp. HK-06]
MNNKLVTIATFGNSVEASLAQQLLEAEGIPAFLMDDNTAGVAWHLTIALGWIKLKVMQADVDNAIDILTAVDLHENLQRPENEEASRRHSSFTSKNDKILDDAFNAAIIGLFVFPLCVLQLYSLSLLIYLLFTGWVSSNQQLKAVLTFLLNVLILGITWMIFTALVS